MRTQTAQPGLEIVILYEQNTGNCFEKKTKHYSTSVRDWLWVLSCSWGLPRARGTEFFAGKILFWVLCRCSILSLMCGVCNLFFNSKPWDKGAPVSLSPVWCSQKHLITCSRTRQVTNWVPLSTVSPWSRVLVLYFIITTAGNWLFLFLKLLDICSSFNVNISLSLSPLFLIPHLFCFSVLSCKYWL